MNGRIRGRANRFAASTAEGGIVGIWGAAVNTKHDSPRGESEVYMPSIVATREETFELRLQKKK